MSISGPPETTAGTQPARDAGFVVSKPPQVRELHKAARKRFSKALYASGAAAIVITIGIVSFYLIKNIRNSNIGSPSGAKPDINLAEALSRTNRSIAPESQPRNTDEINGNISTDLTKLSEEDAAPAEPGDASAEPGDAALTEPEAAPEAPKAPTLEGGVRIRPGRPLAKDLAVRYGLSAAEVQELVDALQGVFDFKYSKAGDLYRIELSPDKHILSFEYEVSPVEIYKVETDRNGALHGRKLNIPLETRIITAGGTITKSLFASMADVGLSAGVAARFVDILGSSAGYFNRQRPGDTFRVAVEEKLLNGQHYTFGDIDALEYDGEKIGTFSLFRYEKSGERLPYFSGKGMSIPRPYIRIPLYYSRVSSPFDLKRFHPILKRRMPHMGVDFSAAVGTPVWAALDGTVSFVGRKGPNGLLVVLDHDHGARTYYAHLSRYSGSLRLGGAVKQGQVIGFVGSTGRSTGPHLHFALKIDGRFVDPLKYKVLSGRMLAARQLASFKEETARLKGLLSRIVIKRPQELPAEIEGGSSLETGADL